MPRCVVNGLDNFDVGLSNISPTRRHRVDRDSFSLCGHHNRPVSPGEKIIFNCDFINEALRYVIVRRTDNKQEMLCLAEVAVYAAIRHFREYWQY